MVISVTVTVNLNHTVRKQSSPSSLAHNTRMQRRQISEEIDRPIMHKHLTSISELCSSPTTASLALRICFRRVTTSASNSSSATASMHISSRHRLPHKYVMWLVVKEVRGESFRLVTEHHHYNTRRIYASLSYVARIILFIVKCIRRSGIILIP